MAKTFSAVELIRTKRDGGELDDHQIRWLINAYTDAEHQRWQQR